MFPRGGARLLDTMLGMTGGSRVVVDHLLSAARARIAAVRRLDRILVIADLNIGDAVMMQACIAGLRDFLPHADIDYVISRLARHLVAGNPEITELFAVLHGGPAPTHDDFEAVRSLVMRRNYDLVFNFCPLIRNDAVVPRGMPVLDIKPLAATAIRNQRDPRIANHVVVQAHQLIHRLFSRVLEPVRSCPFTGVSIQLSEAAVERASRFLGGAGLTPGDPFVLFNPDTLSPYTRMPLELQATLLRELAALPLTIVLGAGHAQPGIEQRLLESLTTAERARVRILPATVALDTYAAVIDAADCFFSGDTGPLHIAAARKVTRSSRNDFRNRTVVISAFGATPARFYGYASARAGFFPANQSAPSFVHIAWSPCRNLTCINKMAKTCRVVRCFEALDAHDVVQDDVVPWLNHAPHCVA